MQDNRGVARTLELPLAGGEETGLARSAGMIQNAIESLDEQISIGTIPSVQLFLEQKELE